MRRDFRTRQQAYRRSNRMFKRYGDVWKAQKAYLDYLVGRNKTMTVINL